MPERFESVPLRCLGRPEAIDAIQDDPEHLARRSSSSLIVDLLADDADEALEFEPSLIRDEDGLQMGDIPTFERCIEVVRGAAGLL